jgi:hypothetical protein
MRPGFIILGLFDIHEYSAQYYLESTCHEFFQPWRYINSCQRQRLGEGLI